MIYFFFVLWLAIAAATFFVKSRRAVHGLCGAYVAVHAIFAERLFLRGAYLSTSGQFFSFDEIGTLFYVLLAIVATFVIIHSKEYLKDDTLQDYKRYFALLMLLITAITGVYFANNIAITWILMETTTLCAAGILYHRHSKDTLEATWKYLFVCSTGIAIAYLGILLLAAAASNNSLNYEELRTLITEGNPLYLKVAFVLILTGYSCKMEIFPLYTVGVDANYAAPAPASAFISTALVNAGFVSIYRIYSLYAAASEVFVWARHLLILIGILSLAVGAMFLRRTNNYKRFLSYSTVENMGIVAIGMGIGGVALWAAVFHVMCHTLVKSSMFFQVGIMRHVYDSYSINRIGNYMNINRVGAIGFTLGTLVLLAFPPSPLFISEVMIFSEIVSVGSWWLLIAMLILMCVVIYSIWGRSLRLGYHSNQDELHLSAVNRRLSYLATVLLAVAIVVGVWQPDFVRDAIDVITNIE